MNIYLTLDYELYFGHNSGTQQKCIIEPSDALLKVADKYNAKLCFFVDAGYIFKLEEESRKHPQLLADFDAIKKQIETASNQGHDIQLHIHPHWEDSYFIDGEWIMKTDRYKLSDFNKEEAHQIVSKYTQALQKISPNKIFAYRAGGWCMQPFEHFNDALFENGIWLDSTVYRNGKNTSERQNYDFTHAPDADLWNFSNNPLKIKEEGRFTEVAIAHTIVPPQFYWNIAFMKIFKDPTHKGWGNGNSLKADNDNIMRLLLKHSVAPVSFDGYKSTRLQIALEEAQKKNWKHFVTLGHPKSTTKFSLGKLEEFISKNSNKHNFVSYTQIFGR